MSWETLFNAIRTRWRTLVEDPQSLPTKYDNAEFTPPAEAAWAHVTVLPGVTDQVELGQQKTFRTPGVVVANLYVPLLLGDQAAVALADLVKTSFRAVTASGVVYGSPSLQQIGSAGGKWWQVSVSCPFYSDEIT